MFISYARSSESDAERVAAALRAAGYSVWRDDALPAHRAYAEVIEERLRAVKAVVVLWSADAVRSQWVRAEADLARNAGTLVQASLDGVLPPLPFNQIQCAILSDWTGDTAGSGWRKLHDSVAELLNGSAPSAADHAIAPARRGEPQIIVIPFANVGGDEEQEYFSDGVSEDIITDLSKLEGLAVVSRNSSFKWKGQPVTTQELARQLGVTHVLEGSVRKAGRRIRINAQLVDTAANRQLWAERFDRELTDIFDIQDEIARAIIKALRLKLLGQASSAVAQRGTESAEAYNIYLMARRYWISGNDGDTRREQMILRLCKRAIEIDPSYARAWALMALAQSQLRFREGEAYDDGREAAERALVLDPTLPEPYAVRARAYHEEGQHDLADAEIRRALELEPDSWEANKIAGKLQLLRGNLAEALPYYEKAAGLVDTDYHTLALIGTCYRGLGDVAAAKRADRQMFQRIERIVADDPGNGAALGLGAIALASMGEKVRAFEWIDRALAVDPGNRIMRYNLGCALANELGDPERALDMIEPYFAELNSSLMHHVAVDPDLDPLREHPRFQAMLAGAKARIEARDSVH